MYPLVLEESRDEHVHETEGEGRDEHSPVHAGGIHLYLLLVRPIITL